MHHITATAHMYDSVVKHFIFSIRIPFITLQLKYDYNMWKHKI